MRLSCNGCRILRKGCSDNCNIRPCLQQWIKSPESQANATVFLAKFYGRAGLMNLINTGPQHLRPAIFRSLLYEACGRIVNPIYGSVGLLWSGSWHVCQNVVETVLQGSPITQIASDTAVLQGSPVTQIASDTAVLQGSPITQIASDTAVLQGTPITQIPFVRGQPLKAYDIRHNSKDDENSAGSAGVHRVRTRGQFKRSGAKGKVSRGWIGSMKKVSGQCENSKRVNSSIDLSSHESALSHQSEVVEESLASVETSPAKTQTKLDGKVELELTLGHEPVERGKGKEEIGGVVLDNSVACAATAAAAAAGLDLRLDCPV